MLDCQNLFWAAPTGSKRRIFNVARNQSSSSSTSGVSVSDKADQEGGTIMAKVATDEYFDKNHIRSSSTSSLSASNKTMAGLDQSELRLKEGVGREQQQQETSTLEGPGTSILNFTTAKVTDSNTSSDDQTSGGLVLTLVLLASLKWLWSKIWKKPESEIEIFNYSQSSFASALLPTPDESTHSNVVVEDECSPVAIDPMMRATSPCPSAGSATSHDESSRAVSDKGQEEKSQNNAATGSTILERELIQDLIAQNKLFKSTMEEQSATIQQIQKELRSRDDRLVEVEADRDRTVKKLSDQVVALSNAWRQERVDRTVNGGKDEAAEWRYDMEKCLEALKDLVKKSAEETTNKQRLVEKEVAVRMQGIKDWLKAFEKNQTDRLAASQNPNPDKELQTLTAELSEVKRDMEVKSKQVNELAHYVQKEDLLIAKLMDSFELVVSKVENVTERTQSQQVQVSSIQRAIEGFQGFKDDELASRVDKFEKEITAYRALQEETNQNLQLQCTSLVHQTESLKKDYQQTKAELKDYRGKDAEFAQELKALKMKSLSQDQQSLRVSASLEDLTVDVASSISSHKEFKQDSRAHRKEMALRIEALARELKLREDELNKDRDTIQSQLSEVQTEHFSSRARQDHQVLELRAEFEHRFAGSSEAIKLLDGEFQLMKQDKFKLSKSEECQRETTKKMMASVEDLQERLDFEIIARQASHDNQVNELKSAFQTLEDKHQCLVDAMQQSHSQSLSHSRKVADDINASSRGLQGSIDSMNTNLISLKSQILGQQEDLVKVTESHKKLKSQVEVRRQEMEVASKEVHEQVTSQVEAAFSRIGGLEKHLGDAMDANEDQGAQLAQQIEALSGKVDNHREISVTYQKDTEWETSDLRSSLRQLGNKLQNGLTEQQGNCDQLGIRCRDLKQSLDGLSKEVERRGVEHAAYWQEGSIPKGLPTQVEVAFRPTKPRQVAIREEDNSSVHQLSVASPTYHSAAIENPVEQEHGSIRQVSVASPTFHSAAIENLKEDLFSVRQLSIASPTYHSAMVGKQRQEDHSSVHQISVASPTYHSAAIGKAGEEDYSSVHQLSVASPTYHSAAIENPGLEDHSSIRQLSVASPTYHSAEIENPGEEDHSTVRQLSVASPTYHSAAIENRGEEDHSVRQFSVASPTYHSAAIENPGNHEDHSSVHQLSVASPTYHSVTIDNPGEEDNSSVRQLSVASPTYHSAVIENPGEEGYCSLGQLSADSPPYSRAIRYVESNQICKATAVITPREKQRTQPGEAVNEEAVGLLTQLMTLKAELIRRTQSVIDIERYTKERSDDFSSRAEVLNNEIEVQRQQLKKWQDTTHKTEACWVEKCDELHRINTEIARLRGQLEAVRGEITNLQDALEEDGICNGLQLRLEGKLGAQRYLLHELTEKLGKSETCAAACETECSKLKAKRELFEDELERRKTRVSTLRSNLRGVLDLVAEERAALQQELLVKRQERDSLQDKTNDLYLSLKERKRENPNLDLQLSDSFLVTPERPEVDLLFGPAAPTTVSELEPVAAPDVILSKEETPHSSTTKPLQGSQPSNAEQAETGHKLSFTKLDGESKEVLACAALQEAFCRTKEAMEKELDMSKEHRALLAEKMDQIAADRGKAERLEVQVMGLHHQLENNRNQIGQVKEEQSKLGSDLNARVEALENDIRSLGELQQEAAHEEPDFDILTKKIEALATSFSTYGEIVAKVGALGNSIERCEGQLQRFEKDKDDTKAHVSSMIDLFKTDLQALKHSFEENLNNKDVEFSCLLAKVENLVKTSRNHEKQLGAVEDRLQTACKSAGREEDAPKAQIPPELLLQQMMEKYVDLAAKINLLASELEQRDKVLERNVQDRDSLYLAQMDAVRNDLENQQAQYKDEVQLKVYNTMLNVFKALAKKQGLPSGVGAWNSAEESLALTDRRANNSTGRDKENRDTQSRALIPQGRGNNQSAMTRQRGGVGYSMASGIISDNLFVPVIMAATPMTNAELKEEGKSGDA